MSGCKTKADLYREYARVIDMCDGTEVHPWECVKCEANTQRIKNTPVFDQKPECYQFALCLVEDKPVFEGDELYCKESGQAVSMYGVLAPFNLGRVEVKTHSRYLTVKASMLTWQPPQPADPYAPFKDAIKSVDKWVQVQTLIGWEDMGINSTAHSVLLGTSNFPAKPEDFRIVDKIITWKSSIPDSPIVKISYNRETRQVTAELDINVTTERFTPEWWLAEIRRVSGDNGKRMLTELVEHIQQLKTGHDRYEKLRKLAPRQFQELWGENIKTGMSFDELVDKL